MFFLICTVPILNVEKIKSSALHERWPVLFNAKHFLRNIPGEHSLSKWGLLIRFCGFRMLDGFLGSTKLFGLESCSTLGLQGWTFSKSNLGVFEGVLGVSGLFGSFGVSEVTVFGLADASNLFLFKFKGFNAGFAFSRGVTSTYDNRNVRNTAQSLLSHHIQTYE